MSNSLETALAYASTNQDIASLTALARQERQEHLYTLKVLAAVLDKIGPLLITDVSITHAIPAYTVSSQSAGNVLISSSTAPGRGNGR